MNTDQLKFCWDPPVAVIFASIVAMGVSAMFATVYPWFCLLCAIVLLAGGIAFAAWPPMSERIAQLRSRPSLSVQHRIHVAMPAVFFSVILLFSSQSQIRSNWLEAEVHATVRAEVARGIENAIAALERKKMDEALKICDLLYSKANLGEKYQIAEIRARAKSVQQSNRVKAANGKVSRLLSEGHKHAINWQLDVAQSALEAAVSVPLATEFQGTTKLADAIVAKRVSRAIRLLDTGDMAKAKEHVQKAIAVPSATDTTEARQILTNISNREVAGLMASARKSLADMDRDEAIVTLENALAISDATETDEAKQLLGEICEARASEANSRVGTLLDDARRSIEASRFDDALRLLREALAIPHSTRNAEVTARIRTAQTEQAAERRLLIEIAEAKEARMAVAEAARKAEEEYEQDGLLLLRNTVEVKTGRRAITGIVVNRRNRKLKYAQIIFNLYDESGAQVGNAVDNVLGLDANGEWQFEATTYGTKFADYEINELEAR